MRDSRRTFMVVIGVWSRTISVDFVMEDDLCCFCVMNENNRPFLFRMDRFTKSGSRATTVHANAE
eukprot:scaffold42980_cov206-Amphora_coffeaeformis.AAC.2